MDGTVLNFDSANGAGVIRASDGKRYRFAASDWASVGSPLVGDIVDFEPDDGQASEIFVTSRIAQVEPTTFVSPAAAILPATEPVEQAGEVSYATGSVSTVSNPRPQVDTPPIALPSGKGARFFLAYFVAMLPTYILPYFGSNSGFLNTASAAIGGGLLPGYLWHATFIAILCALAYVRGVRIQRGWLVAFPIVGGFFDLVPGFNWIPFVPTVMHAVTMYIGASKDAMPGFDRDSVLPKVKWGYWGLTAFSAWTTYSCFTSVYSGNAGGGGIIMAFGPLIVLLISGFIGLRVHNGFTDNFQSAFDSVKSEGLHGVTGLVTEDGGGVASAVPPTASQRPIAEMVAPSPQPKASAKSKRTPISAQTFCSNCGVENVSDDCFCAECGSAV